MYVKFFFERFWEGEQRNELFVCMPFDVSLDKKFEAIREAAISVNFNDAKRVKENIEANVITDKIFDGIANSKMLLFDLSDDPKSPCQYSKQSNGNVLYELGIANAYRDPEDIIIIRETSTSNVQFDITSIKRNDYDAELSINWLSDILKKALDKQDWSKSKRVKATAKSIDGDALYLMYKYGRNPAEYSHFHTDGLEVSTIMSASRLVDLGILSFESKCYEKGYEHAYHWTSFGYEVMKHLGISRHDKGLFMTSKDYQDYLEGARKYEDSIKKIR